MKLTPIDIRHRQFGRSMFGLNEEEVIEFLQLIAGEMESLVIERNAMRDNLREKELAIADLRDRDRMLQSTIQTATQMSEKIRQDADREARLVLADAQQKAEIITRDSRDSLKKIYQEISDLKRARLQFEANLKGLIQAHLTLVEQGDKVLPQMGMTQLNFDYTREHIENKGSNSSAKTAGVSPLSIDG